MKVTIDDPRHELPDKIDDLIKALRERAERSEPMELLIPALKDLFAEGQQIADRVRRRLEQRIAAVVADDTDSPSA